MGRYAFGGDLGAGDPDEPHHLEPRFRVCNALVEGLEEGEGEQPEENIGQRIDAVEDRQVGERLHRILESPRHRHQGRHPVGIQPARLDDDLHAQGVARKCSPVDTGVGEDLEHVPGQALGGDVFLPEVASEKAGIAG